MNNYELGGVDGRNLQRKFESHGKGVWSIVDWVVFPPLYHSPLCFEVNKHLSSITSWFGLFLAL